MYSLALTPKIRDSLGVKHYAYLTQCYSWLFVCVFAWRCLMFEVSPLCRKQRVLHALKILQWFEVTIFIALFLKSEDLRRYKFSSRRIKSINTLFRIPFYTNTGLLEDRTWLQYYCTSVYQINWLKEKVASIVKRALRWIPSLERSTYLITRAANNLSMRQPRVFQCYSVNQRVFNYFSHYFVDFTILTAF